MKAIACSPSILSVPLIEQKAKPSRSGTLGRHVVRFSADRTKNTL